MVCALRRATNVPLDDLTFVVSHFLPHLNRASIWRILQAENLNRRPKPASDCPTKGQGTFGDYDLGFVHIDIKHLPKLQTADGERRKRYLFVAIDRRSRCFTPAFARACAELGAQYRHTKPRTPQTNGMVERFNGRVGSAVLGITIYTHRALEQLLRGFNAAYNDRRQRVLDGKTPDQVIAERLKAEPKLARVAPNGRAGPCDTTRARLIAEVEGGLATRHVVVLDNLAAHKVAGAEAAIRAVGASLLYLPPYSPDLSPTEQVFSKLKALLRAAAARTKDALWTAIGQLLDRFGPAERRNYLTNSGYEFT